MGLNQFLNDFLTARAQRTNPAVAAQMKIDNQRAYDKEQALRTSSHAGSIYDELIASTQDAEQKSIYGRNKSMMESGDATLINTLLTKLMPDMQKSSMNNLGNRQTQSMKDKTNITMQGMRDLVSKLNNQRSNATSRSNNANTVSGAMRRARMRERNRTKSVGYDRFSGMSPEEKQLYSDFKAAGKGPGININTGDQVDPKQGKKLTSEELDYFGINGNWIFNKGIPTPLKSSTTTVNQDKAAGFSNRMDDASRNLKELESTNVDPTSWSKYAGDKLPRGIGGWVQSDDEQRLSQAQGDWILANVRDESGAQIPVSELEQQMSIYFESPGDKQGVIDQKRRSRDVLEKNMRDKSGARGGALQPGHTMRSPVNGRLMRVSEDGTKWEFADE